MNDISSVLTASWRNKEMDHNLEHATWETAENTVLHAEDSVLHTENPVLHTIFGNTENTRVYPKVSGLSR
jgi:hypothetical protein